MKVVFFMYIKIWTMIMTMTIKIKYSSLTHTYLTHEFSLGSHSLTVVSLAPDAIKDRKGCQSTVLTSAS